MTRPSQPLIMVTPDLPRRPVLQAPHVSSRCAGTCGDPGAPCRDALQLPALNAAARGVLHAVKEGGR